VPELGRIADVRKPGGKFNSYICTETGERKSCFVGITFCATNRQTRITQTADWGI